jgi:hypothetical protein
MPGQKPAKPRKEQEFDRLVAAHCAVICIAISLSSVNHPIDSYSVVSVSESLKQFELFKESIVLRNLDFVTVWLAVETPRHALS